MSLFDTGVQQALASSKNGTLMVVKLGEVTSLDSHGRAKVKFAGEGSESNKIYTYLENYIPEVGDKVALIPQGDTWIILGRVTDGVPAEETPYVTSDGDMNKLEDGGDALTLNGTNHNLIPNSTDTIDIGSTSSRIKNVHAKGVAADSISINGVPCASNYLRTAAGDILSLTAGTYPVLAPQAGQMHLGTTAHYFGNVVCNKVILHTSASSPADIEMTPEAVPATQIFKPYMSSSTPVNIKWASNSDHVLIPNTTKNISLGTSNYKYKNVHAYQFYQDGSAITTSDKRKKKSIKDLGKKYVEFFKRLRPVTYKMKDGDSGRFHAGFIAQEVEEAMKSSGVANDEFAGLIITPEGDYALRYEEFIALQTKVIQNLTARVEDLERRLK